jgi:hypothetical protein
LRQIDWPQKKQNEQKCYLEILPARPAEEINLPEQRRHFSATQSKGGSQVHGNISVATSPPCMSYSSILLFPARKTVNALLQNTPIKLDREFNSEKIHDNESEQCPEIANRCWLCD